MQMTREAFHAYLCTLPYDDYIVRVKYKYLFEKEWKYQNVIYYFNADEYKYELIDDFYEGQEEVYILGFIGVSSIDLAVMSILPLVEQSQVKVEDPESEGEDGNT